MATYRLLGCFPTHKSKRRVFSESPSPSQEFETDLAQGLQELLNAQALDLEHASLSWVDSAVDMVIFTQAFVKQAICSVQPEEVMNVKVLQEQYMEDGVKLLDVCGVLKETLGGVHTYVKATQNALKHLKRSKLARRGDLLRARHALLSAQAHGFVQTDSQVAPVWTFAENAKRRLSACRSLLRRMGDNLSSQYMQRPHTITTTTSASSTALPAALYAGEMVTLFVFRLLSAALTSPEARRSSPSLQLAPLRISGQPAWESPLLALEAQLNTELARISKETSKRAAPCTSTENMMMIGLQLPDLNAVDGSLAHISDLLMRILEQPATLYESGLTSTILREDLRNLTQATSRELQTLENSIVRRQDQLERLFSSLVDTRMAVLNSLTESGTDM